MENGTALVKRIADHKAVDVLVKTVILPILTTLVVGVIGWLWNTSAKLERIEERLKQDRSQWSSIKRNADDVVELRVRVGVLERSGAAAESLPADVERMFREIERERGERREEDVEEFIMMEQRTELR